MRTLSSNRGFLSGLFRGGFAGRGIALFLGVAAPLPLAGFETAWADEPSQLPVPPTPTGSPSPAPWPAPPASAPATMPGTPPSSNREAGGALPPAPDPAFPPTQELAPPASAHSAPSDPDDAAPVRAAHPRAHRKDAAGQASHGFVVAASLGVRPASFATGSAGNVAQGVTTQGGLALGYKKGRVVVSLGFDLTTVDAKDSFGYKTSAAFLFVPGLQVALFRSRDHRVELLGSLRVGAGSLMSSDPMYGGSPPVLTMYEIAPALRYYLHKQFAVHALAGYGGQYSIVRFSSGSSVTGVHSLVTTFGAIGIF